MNAYRAPIKEMLFVLDEVAGLSEISRLPGYEDASIETSFAILEEASRFATEILEPLNQSGDHDGAVRLSDGSVKTPKGFKEAYRQFAANGWNGLTKNQRYGGQGLPQLVAAAVEEMWHSANMAFDLCPLLTQGAIEAIELVGSEELKDAFLPKMVAGEWTGTMNLTESQAGSDLAAVRTRAVLQPDGSYRLFGQKIFITYGEHDFTENIVHLVLARVPDAPAGVKGISLFVAPKYLLNADGEIGERNDIQCVSLEHKLGIHASPTAVLAYGDHGGAKAYLLGGLNRGLEYMFVMMNLARFSVGMEGVGIAERAYQRAVSFSRVRVQGRAVGMAADVAIGAIIDHPDVQRMLMTMRATTEAMRALAYTTAATMDFAKKTSDRARGAVDQQLAEFMVPIVKGWCTESAQQVADVALQVHGGMGFIEETGAAQYVRDARITTIYEGTTAIQANDFLGRKTIRDGGGVARNTIVNIQATATELSAASDVRLRSIGESLLRGSSSLTAALDWLLENHGKNPRRTFVGAVPYLMLWGLVCGGWQMGRAALAANKKLNRNSGDESFLNSKISTANFYAVALMPQCAAMMEQVVNAADATLALATDQY